MTTTTPTTIGVIGGGQLGRMLALAGIPLGFRFVFLDPSPTACARQLGIHLCAPYDDAAALAQLAELADVITFEFENAPAQAIAQVAAKVPAWPSAQALEITRDRLHEKQLFRKLDIATTAFANIESQADLEQAIATMGLPAILKTRRLGYDGKGQAWLRSPEDIAGAFSRLGSVPCLLEQFVPFASEVSLIAARSRRGDTCVYPLIRNVHHKGILHHSTPAPDHPLQGQAESYAHRILTELDYVGVLAFEFFVHEDKLIANEIAPRVHNSGHWSIEGAVCSQFENHLRAITDLPLGSTALREHVTMLNLIGSLPDPAAMLAIPGAHLHDYDKADAPGRKVGHVTLSAASAEALAESLQQAQALLDMSASSS